MPLASPYNDETTDSSSGQIHPSPWILDSFERILLLPETHPSTFAISFQIKRTDRFPSNRSSIQYYTLERRQRSFHPSYTSFIPPTLFLPSFIPFLLYLSFYRSSLSRHELSAFLLRERERERERERASTGRISRGNRI